MGFIKFNRKEAEQKANSFGAIAEGDYELFIKDGKWDPQTGKPDKAPYFNLELAIRTDVDQDHGGRKLFHSFYISRNEEKVDQSMDFINRFNLALGIPDGVEFATEESWLKYIIGKPVKAHVGQREYNGKTYAEVKYFMESEFAEMAAQENQSNSSGLTKTETKPKPNPKIDDDPFSSDGQTIDISDDDLPF